MKSTKKSLVNHNNWIFDITWWDIASNINSYNFWEHVDEKGKMWFQNKPKLLNF